MNIAVGRDWLSTAFILTGFTALTLLSGEVNAQDSLQQPVNRQQDQRLRPDQLQAGYQTQIPGWLIRPGDTLQVGQGSRPGKAFAYLYQADSLGLAASVPAPAQRRSLPPEQGGQRVVLKELGSAGSGTAEVYGLVITSRQKPYYLELEKAINVGEILPPIRYRPSAQAAPALPVVAAQALINLKAKRDAGQINQAEYERQKKKLLSKQN